ncbi:DNA-processing protein DprA [Mesorhizobium sp. LCM 4577]|uniref:DNA-processing protein DprA n=1 Tax=Mesorhizobium sp. LCM 4577 TaxID=1848288 RepID=UPI0030829732
MVASASDIATHKFHPAMQEKHRPATKEPAIGATMTLSHKTPTDENRAPAADPCRQVTLFQSRRPTGCDKARLTVPPYPQKLRDAKRPIELLYFQGIWELTETRRIAIVGAREASDNGKQRSRQLVATSLSAYARLRRTTSLSFRARPPESIVSLT